MIYDELLRIAFLILFLYALFFVFQWLIGLILSCHELKQYKYNKYIVSNIMDDKISSDYPVSVLIPAYNESNCINATIQSLLDEDYPALNIIIINDGSSDDTEKTIIEQFKLTKTDYKYEEKIKTKKTLAFYEKIENGKRIFLISKENGGKSDALNCGLNVCEDMYALVLDADTLVEKGSVKNMVYTFLTDEKTIVCAGAVGNSVYKTEDYKKLNLINKVLVFFQRLEYYRTFYMQRLLFDKINANVIVSGAFALFNADILKRVGGYSVGTIGEDMEITMRLHAFCKSQNKKYKIKYTPEARCNTQVPFSYKDYFYQRKRWHIGMIQSLKMHRYMLGSRHYGAAGVFSGTYLMIYELLAPFIEIFGIIGCIFAIAFNLLNINIALFIIVLYTIYSMVTHLLLILELNTCEIEKTTINEKLGMFVAILLEPVIFHPFNIITKINAFFKARTHRDTWIHSERMNF